MKEIHTRVLHFFKILPILISTLITPLPSHFISIVSGHNRVCLWGVDAGFGPIKVDTIESYRIYSCYNHRYLYCEGNIFT